MHGTRSRFGAVQKTESANLWPGQDTPQELRTSGAGIGEELQRLVGLVERQYRLIIAVTLAITVLVGLVTLQLTPIYESSALVLVDPRQMNIMDPQSQVSLLPGDTARVESEVGMLRSPSVLLAVIGALRLTSDPEFAPQPGWRDWLLKVVGFGGDELTADESLNKTLEALEESVSVDRRGLTYLIDVKARSNEPAKSAELANALANAHIRLQIAAKVAVATGISGALRLQASETGASLSQSEVSLNEFYNRSIESIADPVRRAELLELRRQAEQSEAERRRVESDVASATLSLRTADWESLTAELESDALRKMNEDRNRLLAQIERTEEAGDVTVDLRGQLAALEEEMTREAQTTIEQAQDRILSERSSGSELENTFRQQLINELPPASVAELRQLQQEALASSAVYENLVTREKAVAAQQNLQVPDSRIVSDAIPPAAATYPRKAMIVLLAGLASLALALGLAFLRENYVGGFIDEEQTEAVLRIPALASVPQVAGAQDDAKARAAHAGEIVTHPLSPYSEAIRRARLGLEAEQPQGDSGEKALQVILVTSALPSEGKTQTAISLARSFALAGRRVLLIDADLRRPTIHRALGITPDLGLSDVLTMKFDLGSIRDVALQDPLSETLIIPGSPVRHSATSAMFESRRFDKLLTSVASQFDVVVLDSSPLLPVVDARLLVRFATAVVLVVRWAKTSQHDARAALNDLARHNQNGTLIAAILNRVERTSMSYGYGRYYAPYYLDDSTDR